MQPGIYELTDQEHRSLTQFPSISELKLIERAPLLFKHARQNQQTSETTKAQLEGIMFHMAILEPHKYTNSVRVYPDDIDFRTKAGKEFREKLNQDKLQGIQYLPASLIDRIADCRNDLLSNPLVTDLLDGCEVERTATWVDPNFGIQVRGRIDAFHKERGYIFDLKTTVDAKGFERQIVSYSYHKQAAFYADALEILTGKPYDFYWLVVEKNPPYLYRILKADKDLMRVGRTEYKKLLERYSQCSKENKWPGLGNEVEVVSLPDWYLNRFMVDEFTFEEDEHHDG